MLKLKGNQKTKTDATIVYKIYYYKKTLWKHNNHSQEGYNITAISK